MIVTSFGRTRSVWLGLVFARRYGRRAADLTRPRAFLRTRAETGRRVPLLFADSTVQLDRNGECNLITLGTAQRNWAHMSAAVKSGSPGRRAPCKLALRAPRSA